MENSQGGLHLPRINFFCPRHLYSLSSLICHKTFCITVYGNDGRTLRMHTQFPVCMQLGAAGALRSSSNTAN